MYYISPFGKSMSISRMIKRLKDFRPSEGELYTVRTQAKIDPDTKVTVYKGIDGKLKKDNSHFVTIFEW
jgi:hypothetical protein